MSSAGCMHSLIAKHANLKHDSDNQVPVVWSSSLRSVAKHKTRATKYPKHTISQESAEQSQQLHLLAQQGGSQQVPRRNCLGEVK